MTVEERINEQIEEINAGLRVAGSDLYSERESLLLHLQNIQKFRIDGLITEGEKEELIDNEIMNYAKKNEYAEQFKKEQTERKQVLENLLK